jgi:uroporphyrinogen-III synthase
VPLPLLQTAPVGFDWPPMTRSGRVDWLVFTSANGVRMFFEGLQGQGASLDSRIRIAVIGSKTAEALLANGLKPHHMSEEAYGEALFTELSSRLVHPQYTLVYARAEEVNFEPEDLLKAASIEYIPLICYRQVPAVLDRNIIDEFSADDYILFTAPSTVQQFEQLFGHPTARPIAIGRTTGAAMIEIGWPTPAALPRPDVESVLELIA